MHYKQQKMLFWRKCLYRCWLLFYRNKSISTEKQNYSGLKVQNKSLWRLLLKPAPGLPFVSTFVQRNKELYVFNLWL